MDGREPSCKLWEKSGKWAPYYNLIYMVPSGPYFFKKEGQKGYQMDKKSIESTNSLIETELFRLNYNFSEILKLYCENMDKLIEILDGIRNELIYIADK